MKFSILAIVTMIGMSSQTFAETKEFDPKGISKVEVHNESGQVNIEAVVAGNVSVTADKKKFGDHCKLVINKVGSTLLAKVERTSFFKRGDCEVNLLVKAPKAAAVEVAAGSGDVKVSGTKGDLNFRVGSGSVDVDAEVKDLEGKCGSGNVTIKGLTAGGSVKTGSGNVNIVYKNVPAGSLDIKTGSGDAEIILPKSAKVHTSFMAGSGALKNELGDSPDSKFKISMAAGSGDLHIKTQL